MPNTPWDTESAAEAGRKSGEARRRASSMTVQERAQDAIGRKLGALTQELLNAALGEGSFSELEPKTRLQAVLRALEYGLGKPGAASKVDPAKGSDEPSGPTPEDLFE